MTIYEIDGTQYTGGQTIDVISHPRFLSFLKLCINNREYSISSDDLMRAVSRAINRLPALPQEDGHLEGPAEIINQFAEEQASGKHRESAGVLPR